MKKFAFLLLITLVLAAAACLTAYIAAPLAISMALFGKALNTIASVFNIPTWVVALLFLALTPAFLFWAISWTFPQKRRKQAAVIIILAAILYKIVVLIADHKDDIIARSHSIFLFVQKYVTPIKDVDPTKTAWFFPSGEPRLYFLHPATNTWMFYCGAFPGACDPATGVQLQPVTPSIRDQWQAEQMREQADEMIKQEETVRAALQTQRQQLETVQESLRKEKEERIRTEQNLLSRLIQESESKRSEISAFENAIAQDTPQRIADDAGRQLDSAKQKLTDAVKASGNGTPLDLATLQEIAHAAIQNADEAEQQIRAASADHMAKEEIAKKAAAEKIVQENEKWPAASQGKIESENASELQNNNQYFGTKVQDQSLSDLGTGDRWLNNGARDRKLNSAEVYFQSVKIQIRNSTRFTVLVTFSSARYNHIWPAPDRAFIAEAGQTFSVSLAGYPGEHIFYTARARENNSIQWGKCDCMSEDESSPIAVCGFDNSPMLALTESR